MEHLPQPSGAGTVVVDLGDDIGAAIVRAPACLDGAEIEIRRLGAPWEGRHVAVRPRHLPSGVIHAALFESLERGRYEVRVRGSDTETPLGGFAVEGGRVTKEQLSL